MARCFPFHRSDYVNVEEPLIDSIKLQAEKAIAKERKKEKKEKKHRSEKSKEHKEISKHEHTHKKRKHGDRDQLGGQDDCSRELRKHVIDQLEQSSVTEENWLTCPNLNPYDSSDSTQDSSKRRKISASVLVHSGSGLTLRIKPPQQKNTNVERPATSIQPQACNSGRTLDKEQLPVESRPSLIQESRDPGRFALNNRSSVSGKVVVAPQLPKSTVVERSATSLQRQSSNSGRIVGKEQLPLKSRSPLIQESRDSGRHASNNSVTGKNVVAPPLQKNTAVERPATSSQHQSINSGKVVDKEQLPLKSRSPLVQESRDNARHASNKSATGKNVVAPPLQKNTVVERPATSSQHQSSNSGKAVDKEQLSLKSRSPLIQESRDFPRHASNKSVTGKNFVAPPLQKNTVVERPATSSQHQSSNSGKVVDKEQLSLQSRSPLIQESRDFARHASNNSVTGKNVVAPPNSVTGKNVVVPPLQKNTVVERPSTSSQHQSSNSGKVVDKEQLSLQSRSPLIQESRDSARHASNNSVTGKNIVAPPLQKNTVVERPITSSQPQSSISGRAVEKVQLPLKRKSTLIHESRNPELPSSNKRLCVSGRDAGTPPLQKPATSTQPQLQQKSRPLIQESRDSVPPTNKLPYVSGSAKVPPLVLQQDNASKPLATVEQACFSGREVEGVAAEAARGKPHSEHKRSSRTEDMKRQYERQYEDLINNWTPPALNFELSDSGDQDWLFAINRSSAQKCAASPPVIPDCGSTVFPMQPTAQYLPEFNMYALPYVIPF